jgi:hypothetical protein
MLLRHREWRTTFVVGIAAAITFAVAQAIGWW